MQGFVKATYTTLTCVILTATACAKADPQTPATGNAPSAISSELSSHQGGATDDPNLPAQMPDLIGRQYDEALQSLVPHNVRVTKRQQIAQQAAGTVIAQVPAGGSSFSQDVTLTVSVAPAAVPEVTGKTYGDAQQELQQLGFKVVEVPLFDDRRTDGLVVGQDPPDGTTNAGEVRLTVVRRAVETYISDVEPVSTRQAYRFDRGTAKANGKSYSHALTVSAGSSAAADIEYDLSRQYRQLVSELGLSDESSSDLKYRVEIFGDGRQLYDQTVVLGETKSIKLDVTRVLRLRLSVTVLRSTNTSDGAVVLGDIRTQGLESEVEPSPTPSTS